MIICIDLNFWKEIRSADLLTYFAVVLAFYGYCQVLSRDLESWKALFISLKSDLEILGKSWLGGDGYSQETYTDKKSFSPLKIIYPLKFESIPEIIRRGAKELPCISDKFIDHLTLFNERVIAFNSALDHIKKIVSTNPIMSEELNERLNGLGIKESEEKVKFNDFKNEIRNLKKKEKIFHLAENIRRLHRAVHVEIIGNRDNQDKLNYLYHEITEELNEILDNFDKRKPVIIRYKVCIIIVSLFVFFMIEIFLK
ncbi:MAG: hypothetical protein A2271_02305 [Candidatus Moranbacteria bacterium RIFOXYA12_FULL_35_19]|nr:MAG: hypothetical protein UR78_C0008G0011 [Candidatus Moranbacteria bacterium GW2011_GWF2_35_39]OGI30689.1 MAG: hypothetical protein A2343_01055 [Candidatus Moranbacteria bacterium RIFOXYB12_FULL_35_8]OGI35373.1 MAG: hypothetical protein A2271_02305 [Candidatus Moranbacteria bacterium RIFOXYA12_FULL_35_19]